MNKYEKRIVAFIDILGFARLVNQSKKDTDVLQKLCNIIYTITDYLDEAKRDNDLTESSNVTQFSDSIVISLSIKNSYEFLTIFRLLKKIQMKLLQERILLRGGIVTGELIHTASLLLGPGLNNAYYLESECALAPRIMIEPKVMWQFARSTGGKKSMRLKDYDYHGTFTKDLDGFSYVDYFNNVENYNVSLESYFKTICEIIRDNIDNDDIKIRMKYVWMREKLKNSEYFHTYKHIYKQLVTDRKREIE